ncbi:MAG: hypothetical protein ACRDBY_14320 [Cetobacterium sp.]
MLNWLVKVLIIIILAYVGQIAFDHISNFQYLFAVIWGGIIMLITIIVDEWV